MTRSRFLSLIAGVPAAGSVRGLLAQSRSATWISQIASGFLLVKAESQASKEDLSLFLVNPGSFSSQQVASGRGLAYALAPDRSALYQTTGWNNPPQGQTDDQLHLTLGVTQITAQPWARTVYYPAGFWPLGWSLAISPDGASLYTFIRWVHRATAIPQPGVAVTDTDASFYETFAYIFDTKTGNFLPKTVDALQTGGAGRNLDSSRFVVSQALQLDVYSPEDGSVHRYHVSRDGAVASSEVVPIPQPAKVSPVTKAVFERCSAPEVTCFVHDDGLVVVAAAGSYRAAGIDRPEPGRQFLTPTVSQDGGLLFVPSGPAAPGSPRYTDRIAVYDTRDLSKVRQLESQRPLGPITASPDGSRIYTILPETANIAALNSVSLWEEKLLRFNTPIKSVAVVP
jgi:hypothetical protein